MLKSYISYPTKYAVVETRRRASHFIKIILSDMLSPDVVFQHLFH